MAMKHQLPPTPPLTDTEDFVSDHLTEKLDPYRIPLAPTSVNPTEVLDIDKLSPDRHVPRDPRLIRLTGNHPFNCEAPFTDLFEAGFLTPPELHYVRNHGPVPEVLDYQIENWKVSIEGLVENAITLSVKQIINELPQVTLPITLVCAGNRRKEQNQVRKGSGFNWGPAGVSTCLHTGPLLRDILALARPLRSARYVCFEGADHLPNGHYGTSIRLRNAMDIDKGVMLSHKMNGEPLRPDHGKPIRVVVPGVIGGRSVKWLTKIIVSAEPSQNFYHIYDNRVLPTVVTPEMAKNDKNWWADERYAIYDLNVNSAIAYPAHDEVLQLPRDLHQIYTIQGYAYDGGGRRVTRIELSLDKGRSWKLANIIYPEDAYRSVLDENMELYGGRLDMVNRDTCFCWCFWSMDVTFLELSEASDIVVRAMDDSMNVQARDMYWNVMGMMNGCWFRVAIHHSEPGYLKFEHPTVPALAPGGWMERVKSSGGDLLDGNWGETSQREGRKADNESQINMTRSDVDREITIEEVEKHNKNGDAWFIVNNEVYDSSSFLNEHPGGIDSIVMASGADATDDFMAIHSETAKSMLASFHIGHLKRFAPSIPKDITMRDRITSGASFLNPKTWQRSKLLSVETLSHDTRHLTFKLEHPEQMLGLPIGQHLFLRVLDPKHPKSAVVRAYTPVSHPSNRGVVKILVKYYLPSFDFPTGGKMTTLLNKLAPGCDVAFKGPLGCFEYLGKGRVRYNGKDRKVGRFAMICAGSGITPIYQILRAVVDDEKEGSNETQCHVIYGNRTEKDILCKNDLEQWSTRNNVKIWNTLTTPPEGWAQGKGRIVTQMLREKFGPFNTETMVLVCGPPGLCESVKHWCEEDGWDLETDLVIF